MPKAILHAPTRVIRRATTEASPVLAADEAAVDIPEGFDIGVRRNPDGTLTYWKLTQGGTKVAATTSEVEAAGVDEAAISERRRLRRLAVIARMNDVVDDLTAPASVREFVRALRALWTD